MALQSSGAISFSDIQTEFGGSNPIAINEYYKNGAYVPNTVETNATVSSMSYTESESALSNWGGNYSNFWRYYENGSGHLPRVNQTGSYLFGYYHWTDQAWTHYEDNWVDSTMTIDKAGDYYITMVGYNTGATRSSEVYLNGSQIGTVSLNGQLNFTAAAGNTLRIVSHMNTIGNYNGLGMYLYGGAGGTTIDETVNTNVPTSGVIQLDDFYGGKKTY